MSRSVRERLEEHSFVDGAIMRHGFVDYMRDYEILVSALGPYPRDDWHRYHFVGCAEANLVTALKPGTFRRSLPDDFVLSGPDYPEKDDPDGFIWGVRCAVAYPGLSYVEEGEGARKWSETLGMPMHEVLIRTNAFHLRLIFAEFRYAFLGREPDVAVPPKDYPIREE